MKDETLKIHNRNREATPEEKECHEKGEALARKWLSEAVDGVPATIASRNLDILIRASLRVLAIEMANSAVREKDPEDFALKQLVTRVEYLNACVFDGIALIQAGQAKLRFEAKPDGGSPCRH